jgi:transglutaminase-like putative cysteine protease
MPKFKIRHLTKYRYETTVRDSANQIMLYPIKDGFQDVIQHTIEVTGDPVLENHFDFFGNEVGTFTHATPHTELAIDSKLTIFTKSRTLPTDTLPVADYWEALKAFTFELDFIDFLKQEPFEALPEIQYLIDEERSRVRSPLAAAMHFNAYIYQHFTYQKGITTVETTLDEIWKIKSGVCQDFAHMLLALLRAMHIPARYVSGYICPNQIGMRGEGATHAWVEAYIPFYGWLGLDPTNNCLVNDMHVKLAVGKNFTDCSPVKGTYRGTSHHTLEVTVTVSYEDGQVSSVHNDVLEGKPETITTTAVQNSFRRYQEIQQQQ